jgi:hypothetical protein
LPFKRRSIGFEGFALKNDSDPMWKISTAKELTAQHCRPIPEILITIPRDNNPIPNCCTAEPENVNGIPQESNLIPVTRIPVPANDNRIPDKDNRIPATDTF